MTLLCRDSSYFSHAELLLLARAVHSFRENSELRSYIEGNRLSWLLGGNPCDIEDQDIVHALEVFYVAGLLLGLSQDLRQVVRGLFNFVKEVIDVPDRQLRVSAL